MYKRDKRSVYLNKRQYISVLATGPGESKNKKKNKLYNTKMELNLTRNVLLGFSSLSSSLFLFTSKLVDETPHTSSVVGIIPNPLRRSIIIPHSIP